MDSSRFDAWTRRRVGLGMSGLAVGLLGVASGGEKARAKKKNPCKGKNSCLDSSHTCGGGAKYCFVKVFGGNVCATPYIPANSCDECSTNCSGCVCVFAAGSAGCNSSYDFLCVIP